MGSPIVAQSPGVDAEQRVLLHGVNWYQYEGLLDVLGDNFPTLRMSYIDSTLEIMTNSSEHEDLKKMIGMLIEAYLQETRTRFHAGGSTTFRKAAQQRGLEPDECYCLGSKKDFPDLAIEVVISSGLVNKLDIYQGLGVSEVWQWQSGEFSIYHLRSTGYESVKKSELLSTLDLEVLARYIKPDQQFDAVLAFRDAIRQDIETKGN